MTEEAYPLDNPDPAWRILQQSNYAARFASFKPEDRGKLSSTLNAGIDAGLSYRGLELQRALIKRSELFRAVQGVFGKGIDFILTPCVSAPPVAAEFDLAQPLIVDGVEAGDLRSEWTPYLSLFDLTGHPAIAMPAGFAELRRAAWRAARGALGDGCGAARGRACLRACRPRAAGIAAVVVAPGWIACRWAESAEGGRNPPADSRHVRPWVSLPRGGRPAQLARPAAPRLAPAQ